MNEKKLRDAIDDYETSIHAIIGFANFYLWDDAKRQTRNDVVVFQGRKLQPVTQEKNDSALDRCRHVTPDLGVLCEGECGVLAEVKLSFPLDQTHWMDDFRQLMKYDDDLAGWPNESGRVPTHDVVLITEQGRAVPVRKFYEQRCGNEINFTRSFALVACNRSDNRQPYYFFQRITGKLSDSQLDGRLEDGVKVPMKVLLEKYSTVRLYDAEPPLPHMMEMIWTHIIVDDARKMSRFAKLKKKQKIPVELDVDDVITRLRDGFTFRAVDAHASHGTPSVPKRGWVMSALDKFVSAKEGEWLDVQKTRIRVSFQRHDDVLSHFVKVCSGSRGGGNDLPDRQMRFDYDS